MSERNNLIDRISAAMVDSAIIVCSLSILGLMLFLVLARYVFGWSVVGVLELVMIFGIWLYMLGSLAASRRREQLVVDLVEVSIKSEAMRSLHRALIAIITAAICVFFIFWSYKMMTWGMKRPQVTPGLSIPLWVPQSAIMIAALGSFAYALRDAFINLRKYVKGSFFNCRLTFI